MTAQSDILVVDDIAANRALLQATLEDAGFHVREASNGSEALAAFTAALPACVLLDIRMPGMDGFEVCRRMRALPGGERVPILFVTALRDVDTFESALLAGGFDFITKPVRPPELVGRVRAALALERASAERDELAALLRSQRDDLMRVVLQNERLAAFLVHDLKNPVAGMQLGADLILKDAQANERVRELATRIKSQAGDLLRMILGLLDLSRGEEGRLVLVRTPIDLGALVDQVLAAQASRAEARTVRLVADVAEVADATVALDVNLARRVLENLLDNALRHAPRGSAITVSARMHEGALELRVADQGAGVPPELREHLFDRFVQGDGAAKSRAGRGLGLAFCKLVVEAHGGRIWIEDGLPGAVFCTRWAHDDAAP